MKPGVNEAASEPTLSGRWAVVVMFAFAITATVTLYVYWKLHVGPFLPLQRALNAEFPKSRPLVEGGQRKKHKNTPKILRITMKTEFDPEKDDSEAQAHAERVIRCAKANFDLSPYEVLELHFFFPEPEKRIHEWTAERKIAELLDGK